MKRPRSHFATCDGDGTGVGDKKKNDEKSSRPASSVSQQRVRQRPWDKPHIFHDRQAALEADSKKKLQEEDNEIPYVTIGGVKFYSDRFYLNDVDGNSGDNVGTSSTSIDDSNDCQCGARGPPPLLNRQRLVESLLSSSTATASSRGCSESSSQPSCSPNTPSNTASTHNASKLQAVIIGTYTVDPWALVEEFPTIFGKDATVPTLVMHGQRGFSIDKLKCSKDDYYSQEEERRRDPEQEHHDGDKGDDEEEESRATGGSRLRGVPRRHRNDENIEDQLSSHVHFSEVTSSWIPPVHVPLSRQQWLDRRQSSDNDTTRTTAKTYTPTSNSSASRQLDPSLTLSPRLLQHRVSCNGVHHPKFMLLLHTTPTADGQTEEESLTVLVSTGNFTRPYAMDGSWVQTFPSRQRKSSSSTPTTTTPKTDSATTADFGHVLRGLLECQTLSTKRGDVTPLGFVKHCENLQWGSLSDLTRRYDFSRAQVHLVATTPGEYDELSAPSSSKSEHRDKHDRRNRQQPTTSRPSSTPLAALKGRQRVQALLQELSSLREDEDSLSVSGAKSSLSCWLPPSVLSLDDILLLQPTSLGGDWNRANMAPVVRSYLAATHSSTKDSTSASAAKDLKKQRLSKPLITNRTTSAATQSSSSQSDVQVLDRARIVWPSNDWMAKQQQAVVVSNHDKMIAASGRKIVGVVDMNQRPSPVSVMAVSATGGASNVDTKPVPLVSFNRAGEGVKRTPVAVENDNYDDYPTLDHVGYCFLSSDTFNRIDLSCLSQMVQFETSLPLQLSTMRPPHFKSTARLFEGNDYQLRRDFGIGVRSESIFSYFLMTSACLSRGAQGESVVLDAAGDVVSNQHQDLRGDVKRRRRVVKYANFELGVLFVSRLQRLQSQQAVANLGGNASQNRVYGFRPLICQCNTSCARHGRLSNKALSSNSRDRRSVQTRFIHLPVPYNVRSPFYQAHDDDVRFTATPYFHEMPEGTATVGHMKITPYGAAMTKKWHMKDDTARE